MPYIQQYGYKVKEMYDLVQHAPEGSFSRRELAWGVELKQANRPICSALNTDSPTMKLFVAYIPCTHVPDFISGKETRPDSHCHFVRKSLKRNDIGTMSMPTFVSYCESSRYHCQFGPEDKSGFVLEITPEMEKKKPKYDSKGKTIPSGNGHTGKRIVRAQKGGSLKVGCRCSFSVKKLYFAPDLAKIVYSEMQHVNSDSLVVHGCIKLGARSANVAHISPEIKTFVETHLRLENSIAEVVRKHNRKLKQLIDKSSEVRRDQFLSDQDIRNIAGKLATETYMKHSNDAQSVRTRVQQNPSKVFRYTESKVDVPGSLTGDNMPFTISIQDEWQLQKMLQYGHRGGVSIDATFSTNHKKESHFPPPLRVMSQPMNLAPDFVVLEDNKGMSLKRFRDFHSMHQRTKIARKEPPRT